MVAGRLACLGSSQHLKSKYGKCYQIEVSLDEKGWVEEEGNGEDQHHSSKQEEIHGAGNGTGDGASASGGDRLPLPLGSDECSAARTPMEELGVQGARLHERVVRMVGGDGTDVTLIDRHAGYMKFEVPSSRLRLAAAFDELEAARGELGVLNYSISQTTLEQVFLSFVKKQQESDRAAEEEAAEAEAEVRRRKAAEAL